MNQDERIVKRRFHSLWIGNKVRRNEAAVELHPLNAPNLILLSEYDIALAAEFLNLGGFDVLEKPLDRSECLHVCASAHRNWTARVQLNKCEMAA
jgi:hypothetical protein